MLNIGHALVCDSNRLSYTQQPSTSLFLHECVSTSVGILNTDICGKRDPRFPSRTHPSCRPPWPFQLASEELRSCWLSSIFLCRPRWWPHSTHFSICPHQKSLDCLPFVSITTLVNNFPLSLGSHIGPVIGLLVVFPKDVLYTVINLWDGVGHLPFPPLVQGFLNHPLFFLIHLPTTSLSPHRCTAGPSSRV